MNLPRSSGVRRPTSPLRSLVRRELRTTRGATIAALALGAAMVIALAFMTPPTMRYALLSSERARLGLHGLAGALGLALAWLQVEDERRSDTWSGFLLLPLDRRVLVATKAAVGVACISAAVGLPALGLASFLSLVRGTGGPVDPVVFAVPLSVTAAGAATYFSAWIASLGPRPRAFGWLRFLALGTGALAALFAAAGILGGAPAVAVAVLPAVGLAVVALRVAARPVGAPSGADRALFALSLAPLFAVALAATAALVGDATRSRTNAPSTSYTLDTNGDVVRVDRKGSDFTIDGSPPTATRSLSSLSPLDRRSFSTTWTQLSSLKGALYYRASTRELAYYDPDDGALVGCLGTDGFTLPCRPLDGELIDVMERYVVTTNRVLYLDLQMGAPLEVMRGDIRGAHSLVGTSGALAVELADEVVALHLTNVWGADWKATPESFSRTVCPKPEGVTVFAGAFRRTPDIPPSTLGLVATASDGTRTAIRCDAEGTVVSTVSMPPEPRFELPPLRGLTYAAAGPTLELAAQLLSANRRTSPDVWLGAAIASLLVGVFIALRSRRARSGPALRDVGLAVLFALTIGPGYLVAILLVEAPELVRGARRARSRIHTDPAVAPATS